MNAPVTFPASSIPTEASHARLLGLYPQRQEGLWMQRVRVPGGRLTGPQWATLAGIAQRLTPDEPLHLTTRQDLEIHGLCDQAVPEVQQLLAQADLTGLGTCGDTIRNVTVCACSGVAPNAPDLLPLAQRLTELLQSQAGAFAMPRKFKISLSACNEGRAQPWINDLGFVVDHHKEGWKFRVVVAGSLGLSLRLAFPTADCWSRARCCRSFWRRFACSPHTATANIATQLDCDTCGSAWAMRRSSNC